MTSCTIIIPVYVTSQDGVGWLEECLQSAISQGCEVVAHDDGSKINIRGLLSKYIKRYSFTDENKGVAYARNRCAELVQTELMIPLDCDDRFAPNSLASLIEIWDGVPIYPDLMKFGELNDPHYQLMDFDCGHVQNYVGFTSVNVLHSKQQWQQIGGWDESIDFYEDGEYNARLLGTFCGKHYPHPIVEYRIHKSQRTQRYSASEYANKLLLKVRSYDMACSSCSKRRTGPGNDPSAKVAGLLSNSSTNRGPSTQVLMGDGWKNMPTEFEGKVLAIYVGGEGKAKHYYQGKGSHQSYKVQYGDKLYVDPRDASDGNPADTRMLVRIKAPEPTNVVVVENKPVVEAPKPPKIVEVIAEAKKAVDNAVAQKVYNLPDISNMSLKEVEGFEWGDYDIAACIRMEARGKNRARVISFLKDKVTRVDTD